jgi:hypothetical protein
MDLLRRSRYGAKETVKGLSKSGRSNMPKKIVKTPRAYRQNKKAFDRVMRHVRKLGQPFLSPSHAVNPEAPGGGGSRNPAKPNLVEFWSDVLLAVQATCPKDVSPFRVIYAYMYVDMGDEIEQGKYAYKILGTRMHSVEQRIGEEFLRRGIYPVEGKGYFWCQRRGR